MYKRQVKDKELEAVKTEVDAEAQDAYDFAESSPVPDPATLYDYTYASFQRGGK